MSTNKQLTKEQELTILRQTVEKLGQDSYCGPWLRDVLPFVERDMRSDVPPMPSWAEDKAIRLDELRNAQIKARQIVEEAEAKARRIAQLAEDNASGIRSAVMRDLSRAMDLMR